MFFDFCSRSLINRYSFRIICYARSEHKAANKRECKALSFVFGDPWQMIERGCCKLKTCGSPRARSVPNFPVFMRKSHENATQLRGKGNFQGGVARTCNASIFWYPIIKYDISAVPRKNGTALFVFLRQHRTKAVETFTQKC